MSKSRNTPIFKRKHLKEFADGTVLFGLYLVVFRGYIPEDLVWGCVGGVVLLGGLISEFILYKLKRIQKETSKRRQSSSKTGK